jgi:hypothetical protein
MSVDARMFDGDATPSPRGSHDDATVASRLHKTARTAARSRCGISRLARTFPWS